MGAAQDGLVTVVIPAYNAASTIDETLCSVRGQTWRTLEILVVDDGSTDLTRDIVRLHASRDPRVRLICQEHGGVAAARNRGVAEAAGDIVAPVDADDLWRPDKIDRQLQALAAGGPRVALVYCWYAIIDEKSRVRFASHCPVEEGDVLASMCARNLVGNGSSALMRKRAVLEAGGYDTTLRQRNAQGCEDLKLYFRIAEKYHFAVVRDHLTGYRNTSTNMSSNVLQMLRSREIVMGDFLVRHPQFADRIHEGRNGFLKRQLVRAIRCRRYPEMLKIAETMLASDRTFALKSFAVLPAMLTRGALAPHINRFLGFSQSPSLKPLAPFPIAALPAAAVRGGDDLLATEIAA